MGNLGIEKKKQEDEESTLSLLFRVRERTIQTLPLQ